jgi:transcriptional regulator with XRE-family HTH domain
MTQQAAAEQWPQSLHTRIGQAIRSARAGRRMSAQQVADETERLRCPITRSQIANYESGRKQSLDIAELMTIAAALKVPPLSLILGGHPDHEIEFLPGQTATTAAALAWFTGDDAYAPNTVPAQPDSASPLALLLDLTRERAATHRELEQAKATFELLGKPADDSRQIKHIADLTDRIARTDRLIDATTVEWAGDD